MQSYATGLNKMQINKTKSNIKISCLSYKTSNQKGNKPSRECSLRDNSCQQDSPDSSCVRCGQWPSSRSNRLDTATPNILPTGQRPFKYATSWDQLAGSL